MDWFFSRIFSLISLCLMAGVVMQFYHEGIGWMSFLILVIASLTIVLLLTMEKKYLRLVFEYKNLYKRLTKEGERVRVQMEAVTSTQAYCNGMPLVDVLVCFCYNKQKYRQKVRCVVEHTQLTDFYVGAKRDALIDKKNPKKIVLV